METCLKGNWVHARKAYSMSRSFVRKRALYKKNSPEERSFSDGNNLDCETIYSQTLKVKDSTWDDLVQEYTENVVNDTQHVFYAGPVFYKGSIICERFSSEYTIHFYLYTRTTWNEDIKTLLKKTYLEPFSKKLPSLSLKSEKLLEPWRFVVSGSKSSTPNHDTIINPDIQVEKLEREMIISFLNGTSLTRWTFMDILKDMYMFDVNHVTFLARWVHFLATPVNIILSMMFLSQFYLLGGRPNSIINLNVSHLLIMIVVASYMRLGTIRNCELWGITVSIVLLCLSLTGRSLYIRICGYDSCSEGIYFLPLVIGFFTSLGQISSDFLYADPNTGDVTLEMLKEILVDVTFDNGLTLEDRLRQVFWFFNWTIPSTFMSWLHQLGVQVAFVMTNIGYRPPDSNAIVKYLKRCDKNSLDIYHRLPKSCDDISRMTMSSPCVLALKECGLMKKESLTTNETLSLCVSIRLCSIYLRKY